VTIGEIKKIIIQEIIDMSDIKLPTVEEISQYVENDLGKFTIIKNWTSNFLNKFYDKKIKFIIKFYKSEDSAIWRTGSSWEERGVTTVKIEIWVPKNYKNYKSISKHILFILSHELVHYKQFISTKKKKGDVEKQFSDYPGAGQKDPIKIVRYYLHQLEVGARSYQYALYCYKNEIENPSLTQLLKDHHPRFFQALMFNWDKFSSSEQKWIKKKLRNFNKEFLNQLYLLQQENK